MKKVYRDYLNERGMSPEVLATIWMIVEVGEGTPMLWVDPKYSQTVEDARELGYLYLDSHDAVRLTHKSRAFLDTLLFLAKEEGEIE